MQFTTCPLPGVVVIEPDVFRDLRGFFLETYHAEKYQANGMPLAFVQDNHSLSAHRTLRGLHLQLRKPQGKLVRAVQGEIWDVAVDIRPDSPTFGHWVGATLSADSFLQIYVPAGYAHGFCVTSDIAQVEYKCTDVYDAADERGLPWNDADLAIDWPMSDPVLSVRDQSHPSFREMFGIGPAKR